MLWPQAVVAEADLVPAGWALFLARWGSEHIGCPFKGFSTQELSAESVAAASDIAAGVIVLNCCKGYCSPKL